MRYTLFLQIAESTRCAAYVHSAMRYHAHVVINTRIYSKRHHAPQHAGITSYGITTTHAWHRIMHHNFSAWRYNGCDFFLPHNAQGSAIRHATTDSSSRTKRHYPNTLSEQRSSTISSDPHHASSSLKRRRHQGISASFVCRRQCSNRATSTALRVCSSTSSNQAQLSLSGRSP